MESFDSFTKNLDGLDSILFDEVIINKPKRLTKNPNKKRQRKTKKQMDLLEAYFVKSTDWSNDVIEEIADKTGLKSKQVSKWLWDQKIKRKIDTIEPAPKTNKRAKTTEVEKFDEFGGYTVHNGSSHNKTVQGPQPIISVEPFSQDRNIKDTHSIGTVSMVDGLTCPQDIQTSNKSIPKPYFSKDIKKNSEEESVISSKHSTKSTSLRDRFSKLSKNKGLKIKAPKIEDIMKKPTPVGQDITNNFISNLSAYSKDFRGMANSTPNSNNMLSATPGIFQQSALRSDKDRNIFPLVFSRGQTPEMKQCTPNNVFSFDTSKSPNMIPAFGSPYDRFMFNDNPFRRQGAQNYFFNPLMNQDSVGKTPDGNVFFNMNNQNSSSKKFKNVFFNFDNKVTSLQGKSAFNPAKPMHETNN